MEIGGILMLLSGVLGAYLAIRKKKKQLEREKLIDKCLKKYADND